MSENEPSARERLEHEALLRQEQGEPLAEDQARAAAVYDRLRRELARLGEDLEPKPEWRARVWQRIDERKTRKRTPAWLRVLAPALAAALVVFVLLPDSEEETDVVALAVAVEPGSTIRRGTEAYPGDRLDLRATIGDAAFAELRVYRNDRELVLRCSDEPPCRRSEGRTLEASVELDVFGAYQPVLLTSARPLPPPAGGLDADAEAALAAGAAFELGEDVVVR